MLCKTIDKQWNKNTTYSYYLCLSFLWFDVSMPLKIGRTQIKYQITNQIMPQQLASDISKHSLPLWQSRVVRYWRQKRPWHSEWQVGKNQVFLSVSKNCSDTSTLPCILSMNNNSCCSHNNHIRSESENFLKTDF